MPTYPRHWSRSRRGGRNPRLLIWSLCLACASTLFLGSASASAQEQPADDQIKPGEQTFQVVAPFSRLNLIHLETRIVEHTNRIKFVDGFDPSKVDVKALSPQRLRFKAESPGVTTVQLVDEFDTVYKVEVFVEPDTRELQAYLERLFPGSAIEVVGLRDAVVLRGWVTDPAHIPQIMAIAEQLSPTVHNQLNVGGTSQVELHVKVMEVSRSKIRNLGFNFLIDGQQYYFSNAIGGLAPIASAELPFGGPPTVTVNTTALSNSEIQFGITGDSTIFQAFIKALQNEALAKILAEPVLVTTSGRPATMLSGGEFPILVPQSLGTVTIQWRQFGVQLEAVPIVLGTGRLRLDIAPEVSERDFTNAVSVNGFVVPGITTRRVNTQVEMRFGQTLMIGGLISTRRTATVSRVPFLGELPWIGTAFSRKDYNASETELVILVTPQPAAPMESHLLPPGGPGLHSDVPTDKELYFDGMIEVPYYGSPCSDCGPGYGSSTTVVPYTEGEPAAAPPAAGPAPGMIEPAGGSENNGKVIRADHSSPFRVDVSRAYRQSPADSSPEAQPTPAAGPSHRGPKPILPGLIQPGKEEKATR